MTTDLFGNPIGRQATFELSLHQKRQATLLYYWMSLDYLKGLLTLIDALMKGANMTLELATLQGRDEVIANEQWGTRDTASNWGSLAWPALEDFKRSTIKLMGWRAMQLYCGTGLTQCDHMLGELSPYWMTPDEKEEFDDEWTKVSRYAYNIDASTGAGTQRPLDDTDMTLTWLESASIFPRFPKLKVRTDIVAETDQMPPRTGVYVPQDDPNGTLQFAWTGSEEGALGDCSTFSDLGLRALAAVGRDGLWVDGQAMAAFAGPLFDRGELTKRNGFSVGTEHEPEFAGSVIGRQCYTLRPCKWYFVELIEGEYEDAPSPQTEAVSVTSIRLRCEAGQPCPREGYWFTPASNDGRRHFKQGEVMPDMKSDYGQTIWQWDQQQG